MKYPFDLVELSVGGAAAAACFAKLSDDEDDKDCEDVLERTAPTEERLDRMLSFFSRASVDMESLLFLTW